MLLARVGSFIMMKSLIAFWGSEIGQRTRGGSPFEIVLLARVVSTVHPDFS